VKNYYGKLFDNSSYHNQVKDLSNRIFEFTEFLTDVLHIENYGAELNATATYHDSCAALRECKIKDAPRKLLAQVKGLQLVEMDEVETCCGFGGSFAIKYEGISIGMADQKVKNAQATKAEYIISTDLSCLMHLDGYIKKNDLSIKTMHIADVLVSGWAD
jgi:L-lactate dehydrogenase complex protein LldE